MESGNHKAISLIIHVWFRQARLCDVRRIQCLRKKQNKRQILTDELSDGSLCPPLQFLQFLCHVTLQVPVFTNTKSVANYSLYEHFMLVGKSFSKGSYQSGFLGARLAKS